MKSSSSRKKWLYTLSIGLLCVITNASGETRQSTDLEIPAFSVPLNQQRTRYLEITEALDKGNLGKVAELMPSMTTYPLYPYLQYRQLSQNLAHLSVPAVSALVKKYPDLSVMRILSAKFINELAKRGAWQDIIDFSPNEFLASAEARCNWNYASWQTSQNPKLLENVGKIWLNGSPLPNACDKLFAVWKKAGKQTPAITKERLLLAMKERSSTLVNTLANQLPTSERALSTALLKLQKDPRSLENFASTFSPPTFFTRQISLLAFSHLARQDIARAQSVIPILVSKQEMNEADAQALKERIASHLMSNDATETQIQWRDNVLKNSASVSLLEQRLRLALRKNDKKGLETWLNILPKEGQEKADWRYWRAEILSQQGKEQEAKEILQTLTKERGFYPMVAAQRLGISYPMKIEPHALPDSTINTLPIIPRVRELLHWGRYSDAITEWIGLVRASDPTEREKLARYALDQGWWSLSVQTTIVAGIWDHLDLRFPMAWTEVFKNNTKNKRITQSYAMAIARQESAWNPKAQSPVGASGLMQVMPTTAKHMVEEYALPNYKSSEQLFDPITNIRIGTTYLDYVYRRFNQNRIFSSAAYNAGPKRVDGWRTSSMGTLNAIAFIESIPFTETRIYVKNVLAYDAYYQHFMKKPGKLLSDAEWRARY